ncbi:hypothetical protein GLOTRDRAFT_137243 [Gloeophyllum trabeum ATCC 11539]|uniref:DUF7330 domain-containing protein n=1 Tax=Gloeophyllum trabeum (strain ATCC 11539 / FP-39264 / Madison 617) TaxID=670483 RepID=S7RYS8_GLOTA|nr:uncharacterized protein GLOTRDRAFT_137243 [Gloeophyllum trabeum ATCC 11539]EPQ58559.1 hypothetical protein GLOTRDRAFT_137243 [Gloeophyllum trabeum ATCC 11539]
MFASGSSSSLESHSHMEKCLLDQPMGTQRVHFQGGKDYDFALESEDSPIDLSLILPHYRARNQPLDHRMSMYIGSDSGPIKVKVCRPPSRTPFQLEIQSDVSDVTVWLPSDFRGRIQHSAAKVTFSAGFTNRIMQHARINEPLDEPYPLTYSSLDIEDEVVVSTAGNVTFRMWDVQTCAPENRSKECWKRMFGCAKKAPETTIDWDFLLED